MRAVERSRFREEKSQQRPDFFCDVTFQSSTLWDTTVGVATTLARSKATGSTPAWETALRATARAESEDACREATNSSVISCAMGRGVPFNRESFSIRIRAHSDLDDSTPFRMSVIHNQ